jgi:glycosyltransferase involved in cell wall biosynthesis
MGCFKGNCVIAIDTRMLDARSTGVESYTRAVRGALHAAGVRPTELRDSTGQGFGGDHSSSARLRRGVSALIPKAVRLTYEAPTVLVGPNIFRRAHNHFRLYQKPLRLHAPGPTGTMHWMYPVPAMIDGWRNIYTLHDAIPFTGHSSSPGDTTGLRRRIMAIARSAAGFLTVSNHARGELIAHLDLPENCILDCGAGLATMTLGERPAAVPESGYFIAFGLTSARKNLARTVAAWRRAATGRRLVVIAADVDPKILAHHLGKHDGLTVFGWLERDALMTTLAGSRALLFPSLAEGFGLPIIEAMALGVPVLTSNRDACAETAAGAALLVAPDDIESISQGIRALSRDDALCARLAASGRARAQDFSPERFGARLLDCYRQFGADVNEAALAAMRAEA